MSDAPTTFWVSVGRSRFSCSCEKILVKIGIAAAPAAAAAAALGASAQRLFQLEARPVEPPQRGWSLRSTSMETIVSGRR